MTDRPARARAERFVGVETPTALSRLVLVWERLEIALWKPLALVFVFLAVALSGVLSSLNPWLHAVVLILFAGGFTTFLGRGLQAFRMPSREQARRRIELVNDLDHRPLETLEDRPSEADPVKLALWREHRRRVQARIAALEIGGPAPQLAHRDPRALRLAAVFLAVIALAAAGSSAPERLAAAFQPGFASGEATAEIKLDAWLAPPAYTGLAPVFIARADAEAGTVPAGQDHATPVGTKLVVQVTGALEGADLVVGAERLPLKTFALEGVAIEHEIRESGSIVVEADGNVLATWVVKAVPDSPPEVSILAEPDISPHFAIILHYAVSDDYGVERLIAVIERADQTMGSLETGVEVDEETAILAAIPVPDPSRHDVPQRVYRDFTAHPWAGGEVRLTLLAWDAVGQESHSDPVTLILPARPFNHPVAQVIVDLRRDLAWNPVRNHVPVAEALDSIAWLHEAYNDDPTVFMALREASRRLASRAHGLAPDDATIDLVVNLLWKTALYLEDGGVSLALARLRAAEQALIEALAEGAGSAELERLMDELQQAMNEYMEAMTEQLRQRLAEGDEMPEIGPESQLVSPADIDQMMNELREMMRNGMTQSAQQMLEQLRRMMENMQAGMQAQMSPESQEAMQMLDAMQDVIESQRELMDRTHQRTQQGQGQQRPGANMQGDSGGTESQQGQRPHDADAVLQDALRRQLGEIMRRFGEMMGEIPEPFGRADEGMAESAERLGAGDPRNAFDSQSDTLDALQDAAEAARNAFMERFQNQMGLGQLAPGQSGQDSMDPFGRQPSETYSGAMQGDVEVPDASGLERAREIRDELRRRSGERYRPESELDYIDRLLDQFR